MKIIPVIDILSARAVRAYRGDRDGYRPLESALCPRPDPAGVLQGYLGLFPFTTIYIADLDAILGRGDNRDVLGELVRRFPGVEFWLDDGNSGADFPREARLHTVIGSETGIAADAVGDAAGANPDTVLSLDFNQEGLLGDADLLEQPERWPGRCIVMALHRVGSGEGPDTALLASLRARAPDREWYAAGGIRHAEDLHALAEAGAAGALIASALHNGTITRFDLENLEIR
ncbi:MAG: HisA/HisF-related TIM barrel protein [Gammaproteobacteria bacterium]